MKRSKFSEATFGVWKQKYAHLGVSELRRMRQLEDHNRRLEGLVAGGPALERSVGPPRSAC